jgi:hypothetical protein
MATTLAGIVAVARFGQVAKALAPMLVTPGEIVTLVRVLVIKALSAMTVTPAGIVTSPKGVLAWPVISRFVPTQVEVNLLGIQIALRVTFPEPMASVLPVA